MVILNVTDFLNQLNFPQMAVNCFSFYEFSHAVSQPTNNSREAETLKESEAQIIKQSPLC